MEASVSSINGLIQHNCLLRIPYFQRSYVWGEKEWERFADDMESTLVGERDYFLGAVILKDEERQDNDSQNGIAKRCMVIDGQQRLTTLNIYMKVLHTLAGQTAEFYFQYLRRTDRREPIIEHSREDKAKFDEVMHMEVMRRVANDDNNIVKAYNYFLDRLLPLRDNLKSLINTINANIKFVVITLTTTDDEQQIFDTINSLGVPLTTCDLVKNFLYGPNDRQAYEANWRVVFESTKEVRSFWNTDASKSRQEKSKENSTIERFFHAFVRIKMWDFKDQLTETQRKDFVKMSNVFSTCKAFVEKFGTDKQVLASQIIEYAQLFKTHLGEEILDDDDIPRYGGIKRISCFINATKQYSVIPYVLYILHEVNDEEERNNIFTYLESYLVRRILNESDNKDYSGLFAESLIGNRIDTAQKLKDFIDEKDEHQSLLAMPTNGRISLKINSRNKGLGETLAQTVLYLYETKLDRIGRSYNDFYVQMLMPKMKNANTDNWPQNRRDSAAENERVMLMSTIGNYFLLNIAGQKSLKKIADIRCSDKVDEMRKWSAIARSNNILTNYQTNASIAEWNAGNIKERNKGLAKIFCENIWNV